MAVFRIQIFLSHPTQTYILSLKMAAFFFLIVVLPPIPASLACLVSKHLLQLATKYDLQRYN